MINKTLIFVLSFFFLFVFAEKVTIKHTDENVTVYVTCFSYREELNKGIIIGEYIKKLAKKYNYSDSIKIFLEMVPQEQPEYSFISKNKIYLHTKSKEFSVVDNLKLIEFAILNRGKEFNINCNEILRKPNSNQIVDILKLSINRPNIVRNLQNDSDYFFYSYYYQNNQYYVYNIRTDELLFITKSIYLFTKITHSRPLIFINNHEFYYKNLNDDIKFLSFSEGNGLSEDNPMKEFNCFVFFNIVGTKNNNIAILNLEKDKIIDNIEW